MRSNGGIWIIGGAVIGVIVIVLGWFGLASPLLAAAAESDQQREAIEAINESERLVLAQMKEQYESLDELQLELEALRLSVPGDRDLNAYFDQLADAAGAAGVVLEDVTVEAAIPYAGITTVVAPVPEPEPSASADDEAEAEEPEVVTGGASPQQSELAAPTLPSVDLQNNLYVLPVKIAISADAKQATALLIALQTGDDRLMLINGVSLTLGSALRGELTGFLFVVHDPSTGPVGALPDPEETPDPNATPTPGPTDPATPAPTGTPTPTPTGTPAS